MKKHVRPTPAYRALRLRLGIFALALWLAAMSILTWAVAADMQHQLKAEAQTFVLHYRQQDMASDAPVTHKLMQNLGRPYMEIDLSQLLPFVLPHRESISSDDALWGNWAQYYGFEAAELFRSSDTANELLVKSKSGVTFVWFSRESWQSLDDSTPDYGYFTPPGEVKDLFTDFPVYMQGSLLFDALRLQGHFVGDQFIPSSIDSGRVTYNSFERNDRQNYSYLMELDSSGRISWHNQYQAEGNDADAVTIYCCNFNSYISPLQPIKVDGQPYDSIIEAYLAGSFAESDSLFCTHFLFSGPVTQDGQLFQYTLLVRAWPLQYAVTRLWPTYLVSLLLLLVCGGAFGISKFCGHAAWNPACKVNDATDIIGRCA